MKENVFKLLCKRNELQLLGTLSGGQSFRWKKSSDSEDRWTGVFANRVWCLKQEDDCIVYNVYESKAKDIQEEKVYNEILQGYFQLGTDLTNLYSEWSSKDKYFKEAAQKFYGIRLLKQDPIENIFSFICSSNNNISRISNMVEKLATFYGEYICDINGSKYYSFPTIAALAQEGVEEKLRANGFGYRAKYISQSAQYIMSEGGDNWVSKLTETNYESAKQMLMVLTGIGQKVADCICLMSLNHLQAVPVDTHVYQIAKRLYMPNLSQNKTVTDKIYAEIGEHFRTLYGPLAGWAHTILFCADLKKFQNDDSDKGPVKKRRK